MREWKEELRNPDKDRGNVRNSVWRFKKKSPISRDKAEYEGCATWAIPRGVSTHHVLSRAFGDAFLETWECKARHSSFLRQECQRAMALARKKKEINEKIFMEVDSKWDICSCFMEWVDMVVGNVR